MRAGSARLAACACPDPAPERPGCPIRPLLRLPTHPHPVKTAAIDRIWEVLSWPVLQQILLSTGTRICPLAYGRSVHGDMQGGPAPPFRRGCVPARLSYVLHLRFARSARCHSTRGKEFATIGQLRNQVSGTVVCNFVLARSLSILLSVYGFEAGSFLGRYGPKLAPGRDLVRHRSSGSAAMNS